jgi:hypothetical protein
MILVLINNRAAEPRDIKPSPRIKIAKENCNKDKEYNFFREIDL